MFRGSGIRGLEFWGLGSLGSCLVVRGLFGTRAYLLVVLLILKALQDFNILTCHHSQGMRH